MCGGERPYLHSIKVLERKPMKNQQTIEDNTENPLDFAAMGMVIFSEQY